MKKILFISFIILLLPAGRAHSQNNVPEAVISDKDTVLLNTLVQEAYQRMQWNLRVFHLYVRVRPDANMYDTLAAWNKINDARNRILKGEPFEDVCGDVTDDFKGRNIKASGTQPAVKGSGGDMGYCTVFNLIYPVENAIYSLPIGQISPIIKSEVGYHLVKVTEKRPAMGKIQIGQVYMRLPVNARHTDSMRIMQRMDSAYQRLLKGTDFSEIALQYSDDKKAAEKGGISREYGVNKFLPQFINLLYNIKEGELTQPFFSPLGYHILKLVSRKPVPPFKEAKDGIISDIIKGQRLMYFKKTAQGQ